MSSSTRAERLTAILSTLVAMGLLAAGVTAHQVRGGRGSLVPRLTADLRMQLDYAYRHKTEERKARRETLDKVLDGWQASDKTARDERLMIQWLQASIRRSMPGSDQPLPDPPQLSGANDAASSEGHSQGESSSQDELAISAAGATGASALAAVEATLLEAQRKPNSDVVISPAELAAAASGATGALEPIPITESTESDALAQTETLTPRDVTELQPEWDSPVTAAELKSPQITFSDAPAPNAVQIQNVYFVPQENSEQAREPPPLAPSRINSAPTEHTTTTLPEPPHAPIATAATTVSHQVEVNIAELSARITGYHFGLDELKAKMVATRDAKSGRQLAELVQLAEELAGQYRFVQLYHGALKKDEQRFVASPRSMDKTVERLRRELVSAEEREGDFLTPFDADRTPLFVELEGRLKKLARSLDE